MSYVLLGNHDGVWNSYPLASGTNRIGRAPGVGIVLPSDTVSREHADVVVGDDGVEVRDLHARNGTFVNGHRVRSQRIRVGDRVVFGEVVLRLAEDSEMSTPHFGKSRSTLDLTWSGRFTAEKNARRGAGFFGDLVDVGEFLVREHSEESVYDACLRAVSRFFDFRIACILMLNDVGGTDVRSTFPSGVEADELMVSGRMVDKVLRERKCLLVRDPDAASTGPEAKRACFRSALVAPLMANRDVMGVIYLGQDDPWRCFERRHMERLQLLANLIAAKISAARVSSSIRDAALVQRALLCKTLPHPSGYAVAARLESCARVGGDLYEAMELPDGRYLYALGDVVGHGMAAALVMANVLSTLRAMAPRSDTPLELAENMKHMLTRRWEPTQFVSLFVGYLDPHAHRLDYVNAGHEPPALRTASRPFVRLESTGPPLGMNIPVPLEAASVEFPTGAVFCAWSDGIPETFQVGSRPPVQFGHEGLMTCLQNACAQEPAEVCACVFHKVNEFLGGTNAQDDRTLLVLRREATPCASVAHA